MNHYETLGISQTSTPEEIKKAYRKLSLKLHPDKKPDPILAEKYKSINEAYEILGNPTEKEKYDFTLKHGSDIFNMNHHPMFGGMGGIKIFTTPEMPPFGMGMDPMNINIEEIFNILQGGVFPIGGRSHNHHHHPPVDIIYNLTINMEQVWTGACLPISIERWVMDDTGNKSTEIETLYVDIPKGIDDNEVIMLPEKGNVISVYNKGSVKVMIIVNNDSPFVRNGLDLIYTHKITLKEALCGFVCDISHINGKTYSINNTKGKIIYDNYKTTINNMGLTRNTHTGNLYVIFEVEFPKTLTTEQIETIKNIL